MCCHISTLLPACLQLSQLIPNSARGVPGSQVLAVWSIGVAPKSVPSTPEPAAPAAPVAQADPGAVGAGPVAESGGEVVASAAEPGAAAPQEAKPAMRGKVGVGGVQWRMADGLHKQKGLGKGSKRRVREGERRKGPSEPLCCCLSGDCIAVCYDVCVVRCLAAQAHKLPPPLPVGDVYASVDTVDSVAVVATLERLTQQVRQHWGRQSSMSGFNPVSDICLSAMGCKGSSYSCGPCIKTALGHGAKC